MGVKVTRIATAGQELAGGYALDATYAGDDVDVSSGLPLDGLLDVDAPAPDDGDVLTWDDGTSEWIAAPGGGGTPATTVTDETAFGIAPAVGDDTEYARQDHTHGSPSAATLAATLEAIGVRGELVVADGTSGPPGVLPSSYVEMSTPDTTTSGTLEDITGATTTITLQRTSHVAAWLNCHVSSSAVCDYGIAISFNGTDHDEAVIHLTATDEGNVGIVHRTTAELPPGTYTVKGRHRRISGGGTPETDRADLLVVAMGATGPVLVTDEAETDYVYADLGA